MSIGFIYFFLFFQRLGCNISILLPQLSFIYSPTRKLCAYGTNLPYLHTATAVIIHLFSHSQTLCLRHKFAISPFCYRSYHSFILPLANFVPTAQICHISILLPQYGDIIAPRNDCMIPNAFYTPLQTITAFGCLVSGTYFSII